MEMKFVCNKCGDISTDSPEHTNSTCKACGSGRRATYIRCECGEWFKANRRAQKFCSPGCKNKAQSTGRKTFRKTIPKARTAQSLVAYYLKAGNIKKPDKCEQCDRDDRRIEAAHYNYDEPLKVRWLCKSCHVKWDYSEPKHATYVVGK